MQDLISVVVPIYNVKNYLEKCVESIRSQSYEKLEIILVNDGSTDGSELLCDILAGRDGRIKVLHKENGGLSDARNAGIDIANGKYITFVDSDDFIDHKMIEILSRSARDTSSDISICGFLPFYEPDSPVNSSDTNSVDDFDSQSALREMMYQKSISNSAWAKLYKLNLFKEDIRYPYGMLCEDLGTTYKLIERANRVAVNTYKGYFYLQREGSILHSKFSLKRLDSLFLSKDQLEFIGAKYPRLVKAAINRYFAEASFLLSEISSYKGVDAKLARDRCMQVVNRYKWVVMADGQSRQKFRFFALISIPSAHALYWLFGTKKKIMLLMKNVK